MLDTTSSNALLMLLSDKHWLTILLANLNLVATLPSILFGNMNLTETDNMILFKSIYTFNQESKPFYCIIDVLNRLLYLQDCVHLPIFTSNIPAAHLCYGNIIYLLYLSVKGLYS